MTKYSICEFQDGNNHRWYQIKIHGRWLPSYFYGKTDYSNYDIPCRLREPTRYYSYEEAENTVKSFIKNEQSQQTKLVGCKEL